MWITWSQKGETMTTLIDCKRVQDLAKAYAASSLPAEEIAAIDAHSLFCKKCRGLIHQPPAASPTPAPAPHAETVAAKAAEADPHLEPKPSIGERLGGAPWWFVSISLHVLIIVLASLVSMAIELPRGADAVVMITELQQRAAAEENPDQVNDAATALDSKLDTPPTDPNSKNASDIVVPKEILERAELGDHFETINPDRPDKQSAYGNEDSHSFHSVAGNADAAGGGGTGGLGMDELIGVGGNGTRGTGGGWGGGNGSGAGVDSGAGKGSFGQRSGGGRKLMVKRHGGSKATESAVDKALRWLAYHQESDGHWDYVKFKDKTDLAEPQHFAALTGLATLAFLGAGHTSKVGGYKDNVRRALTWLKSQQDDKGCYSFRKGPAQEHYIYDQGICTMAMAEAAGMTHEKDWKESAQLGVNFLEDFQNEYAGLRYRHQDGDSDTSIVGWYVMALKSAKVAGLRVDPRGFEGAITFLKTVTKSEGMGTDAMTEIIYRPKEAQSSGFEADAHSTTAIGTLIQLFTGANAGDDKVAGGGNYCQKKLPAWDKRHFYYWYYGTLAMFQLGGDGWKSWNEALKKTLVENQRKGGDEDGSWDSDGDYYGQMFGGRVYTTAIGALCLEVYYRYAQLTH